MKARTELLSAALAPRCFALSSAVFPREETTFPAMAPETG
ncbi:hypothetical protein HMPREF7215_0087 [Pyramidobacter piscolens W5455]|uniref:Uncharacterized protein n=1 Tax=Pyramidobacter piscolens W5455 TaxID=352165 RepID=A0ABM9ZUT0_9BACT|nr:hypothetical protein HMPREF7215_0087 [Pyramidobacter piscolens W5455]